MCRDRRLSGSVARENPLGTYNVVSYEGAQGPSWRVEQFLHLNQREWRRYLPSCVQRMERAFDESWLDLSHQTVVIEQ